MNIFLFLNLFFLFFEEEIICHQRTRVLWFNVFSLFFSSIMFIPKSTWYSMVRQNIGNGSNNDMKCKLYPDWAMSQWFIMLLKTFPNKAWHTQWDKSNDLASKKMSLQIAKWAWLHHSFSLPNINPCLLFPIKSHVTDFFNSQLCLCHILS